MFSNVVFGFVCALTIQSFDCARILSVIPFPSYSHQVFYRPLWRELSLRGHEVILLTTDPMNDTGLTNLTEISWNNAYYINEKYNITEMLYESRSRYLNFLRFLMTIRQLGEDFLTVELENHHVKELIRDQNVHFDLVMIEMLQPAMFAFAYRFKSPFIALSSLDSTSMGYYLSGNPVNPALYPDYMLPFAKNLSFIERVISTFFFVFINLYSHFDTYPMLDNYVRKYFGEGYPSTSKMFNIDMMFVNVNPAFFNRPVLPTVVNIGGGTHLDKPKYLPKEIAEFLDKSKNGVVYFSLGSNVKSRDIPANLRQIIMDTFAEIPYEILWKFEDSELPGKPKNVKIMKWIPQQDLLRHPNIKLFITQGGLQSMDEAVFAHVPLVVIPFMGDQDYNARQVVSNGFGESVDHRSVTKESFKKTILNVINDPKYRNRVRKIAELATDQPMTGLEKAVWWTEYVLRHNGTKHLRSPALHMPFYEYLLLDVIGFCLVVIFALFFTVYKICKFTLNSLFSTKKVKIN